MPIESVAVSSSNRLARPRRQPFGSDAVRPRAVVGLLGLLLSLTILGACGAKSEETQDDDRVATFSMPPELKSGEKTGPVWFRDLTREAGLNFHNSSGSRDKMLIPENISQGALFFDFDNDGDQDIYFTNGGELLKPGKKEYPNALYRNLGNLKFEYVGEGSGLDCLDWSCGAFTTDYDADGWDDVYVTQLGKNRLFRNLEGSGRFEDVTDKVGGGDEGWSTSAAFFDADGDGDLDLYVCNYLFMDPENPPFGGEPCEWRYLKVCCGPRGLDSQADVFYENQDGKFVEATKRFGFQEYDKSGKIKGAYSLGVVTADFDNDGDQDVYVAVDSRPNLFFQNMGGGKFKEVAHEWQVAVNIDATEQAGMGVTSGDLDEDGRLDIFVTNFSHDTNTLYLGAGEPGNIYFDDRTNAIGLGGASSYPFLSWGTGIYDFNLDGLLDIYVASGHVYPQANGVEGLGTSYEQRNQLFLQVKGDGLKFRDFGPEAGPAMTQERVSRGAIFADLNRDGLMDALVTNVDDWPNLLINESDAAGSWLGLVAVNTNPANRHAIGARIFATTKSGRTLRRDILGGSGYLGTSDLGVHYGFGQEEIEKLEIVWPDNERQIIPLPELNRWYRLERKTGKLAAIEG